MPNHKQPDKSQPNAHQSSLGEHSQSIGRHDRFLTTEELITLVGDEVLTEINAESIALTHVERLARKVAVLKPIPGEQTSGEAPLGVQGPFITWNRDMIREMAHDIAVSMRYPRISHQDLTPTQRDLFNSALQQAHTRSAPDRLSPYERLAAIHANMWQHRIHSMQGIIGTQRFLPWHRKYLLECEKLLRRYEPSVRIPYWDYSNDRERPDWVWLPPETRRGKPGEFESGGFLPDRVTMNDILHNNTYLGFTFALEARAHDEVHLWCNGTISYLETAANDPIFWLLHANVDRIWSLWQEKHNYTPLLYWDDAVLDPWGPTTIYDVDSTLILGYWYKKDWVYVSGIQPSPELLQKVK